MSNKTNLEGQTGTWAIEDKHPHFYGEQSQTIIDFGPVHSHPHRQLKLNVSYSRVPKFVNLDVKVYDPDGHVEQAYNIGSEVEGGSLAINIKSYSRVNMVARDSQGVASWRLSGDWNIA